MRLEELRGPLAVGVLPEILRRILVARRSGVLHLACGVEKSDVEFREGFLTYAETTSAGTHLGDLLVQVGFISARDRDACLEIAALSHERLGTALLRHALIDPEHLAQGLALQLREVLARALVWNAGVYSFTDHAVAEPAAREEFLVPRLDAREVLLDATWTLIGDPVLDRLLGDLGRKVSAAEDERLLSLDFRLTPADAFLLSRVDGTLTAANLLEMSLLPADEAKASLAGLLAVGVVHYVGAPAATSMTAEVGRFEVARLAARITSSDPYEVLGVAQDASSEDIRAAYVRLLKSCDPAATADAELRPILRRMSEQLTDAFKNAERRRATSRPPSVTRPAESPQPTPSPRATSTRSRVVRATPKPVASVSSPRASSAPAPAPAPSPAHQAVEPSQALEVATRAFEAGRFHEALAILHEAIPHLEGRARRSARVRKARVLLAVGNGARLAEDELKAALAEDPGNAEAQVALGDMYRDGGSIALATMAYRKALELQPRNVAAREALQALRDPPSVKPAESTSVLKRMFGR